MKTINILGFGIMGRQIAALFQLVGYDVNIWSRTIDKHKIKLYNIEKKKLQKFFQFDKSKLGDCHFIENLKSLISSTTYEILTEDIEVKRSVLFSLTYKIEKIDLLTNTSSYSPSEIHKQAVGLHFFNPLFMLKFIELSVSYDQLNTPVQQFLDELKNTHNFEIIHVLDNRGYLGNYILFRNITNVLNMVEKFGYHSTKIDQVLRHMGQSASLFDIVDLVGIDTTKTIIVNLMEHDPTIHFPSILDAALKQNILGQKNKTSIRQMIDQNTIQRERSQP